MIANICYFYNDEIRSIDATEIDEVSQLFIWCLKTDGKHCGVQTKNILSIHVNGEDFEVFPFGIRYGADLTRREREKSG